MNPIELLAPAKDLECGRTAIQCGADAVYIGAPRFGARENAGNSLEDIAELTRFAHVYWAKVYVTLNTLLLDQEIPIALEWINQLYEIGIDALIVQDAGLLESDLPPLPLIASTQMHNHTPERVAFLESIGVHRAILARELSLDQIAAIRRAAPRIELEYFVHGALCVCHSGQCYMSYSLGGRSANRGQCAQPCRMPYTLSDRQGKVLDSGRHLLSIRDLNLSDRLDDLIEAGIGSFKIEGRLKDKIYVANTVSYYRQRLDEILAQKGLRKNSSGRSHIDFVPAPEKTFNRGFSTHFLDGGRQRVGSVDTPKMMGEALGKVIAVHTKEFSLDTQIPLHPGDGICFFDRNHRLQGTSINAARGKMITPEKMFGLEKGTEIFRNHDHQFLNQVKKSRMERLIEVELTLKQESNGLLLIAIDEDGVMATADYTEPCEPAQKPDKARETLRTQLAKTGGTSYTCTTVTVDLPQAVFLPISTLNELRREVLDRLTEARADSRPVLASSILRNEVPYPETKLTYLGNVLNQSAQAFYRRHGVVEIEPAAESGLDMQGRKVMTTRYCLKYQLDLCPKETKGATCPDPLFLSDEKGHRFALRFNCDRCEMEIFRAENKAVSESLPKQRLIQDEMPSESKDRNLRQTPHNQSVQVTKERSGQRPGQRSKQRSEQRPGKQSRFGSKKSGQKKSNSTRTTRSTRTTSKTPTKSSY